MDLPTAEITHAAPPRMLDQPQGESTQSYTWPLALTIAHFMVPLESAACSVIGFYVVASSSTVDDLGLMSLGLLLLFVAMATLVGWAAMNMCFAREVCLYRDRMVVRQSWRRPLVLAYADYQRAWVYDASRFQSTRLLFFQHNRGCTVYETPAWLLGALEEVRRIQVEEGWYEPDAAPDRIERVDLPATGPVD